MAIKNSGPAAMPVSFFFGTSSFGSSSFGSEPGWREQPMRGIAKAAPGMTFTGS
jgi:hypothetical protein